MPSPADAQALQLVLADVSALTIRDVVALWRKYSDNPDFRVIMEAALPEIVGQYAQASATVTAEWYDELAPSVTGFRAQPVVNLPAERFTNTIGWALHAPGQAAPLDRISGAVHRMVFDASRDTVRVNVGAEYGDGNAALGTRWARYASPTACGFCRMLATRKAVYRSEESATRVVGRSTELTVSDRRIRAAGLATPDELLARRAVYERNTSRGSKGEKKVKTLRGKSSRGDRYHDNCRCTAIPVRPGTSYEPPDYVAQWEDDYQAARDDGARTAGEIAAAMDKAVGGRGSMLAADGIPSAVEQGAQIEAPERQLALNRAPERLAIEAPRQPKMLTAGPSASVAPPGRSRAVAEWLDAEDAHRAAVEYWRRVDADDLHSVPAAQAIADPAPLRLPAVAEQPIDIPGDPSPVADVQAAERAGGTPFDRAFRDFEAALASGDETRIETAAAAMDRAERAEKLVERRAAQRAAIVDDEQNRILAAVEAGDDPVHAEADVLLGRSSQQRKIRDMVTSGLYDKTSATSTVYGQIVERIYRRDFMVQARADGHAGKGFDDLLDSVFQRRVDEIYVEAENATRGHMIKPRYQLAFPPKRLWYVNDDTARKYMSEEMAAWFDQNGRITKPVMRQMILDGSTSFDRYTAMRADYLQ